jgi:hypothetical protein
MPCSSVVGSERPTSAARLAFKSARQDPSCCVTTTNWGFVVPDIILPRLVWAIPYNLCGIEGYVMRVALITASAMGVVLVAHNAWAADLPVRPAPAYQPPPPVVAPNWTGLYLGVNGGWSWASSNVTTPPSL